MNNQEFVAALTVCFETYGKTLSAGVGKFWLSALNAGGISLDEAGEALALHALDPDTGQYLPKIADIVRHCKGGTDDNAEIAWARVQDAVRRVGKYTSVVFDDIKTMNAVELSGGWVKMCNADLGNEVADRAAFRKAYHASKSDACRNILPGLHVDESDEIRTLGDPEKCYQIMANGVEKSAVHEIGSTPRSVYDITEKLKLKG